MIYTSWLEYDQWLPADSLFLQILIAQAGSYILEHINFFPMSVEDGGLQPSQLDPSHFNLRNKGLRNASGRLHKGCVKDAYTKLSIGSIPSNYESIIYHHEQKRGFGTSQKRFYNAQNISELLPSELSPGRSHSQDRQVKPSHSVRGYGPLIAKQQREWRKYPASPGPGRYFDEKEETMLRRQKVVCPVREREEFKRREIAFNKQNCDVPGPGPGHYDPLEGEASGGCVSSFASKERREGYIPKSSTPGPGRYVAGQGQGQVEGQVQGQARKRRQAQEEELFTKLSQVKQPKPKFFLPKRPQPDVPGPGYYDNQMPSFKPLYERIKISNNFVQNSRDRFNDHENGGTETPTGPTPLTYTVPSSFDKIQKKLIDMACFMSQSRREVFGSGGLGPNVCFQGEGANRKNFHFNIRGQWL